MFRNSKTNDEQGMLRLEKGEDLVSAIKRLSARGWLIPAPGKLVIGTDEGGKYMTTKEGEAKKKQEEQEKETKPED